ncbi:dUTP diphosphatase [Helicobacter saguini]|uniref:dUTP diphosphatase n=1 Tax=Helicobacter saguini TaxID=1548018 RepID=A0A347VTC8_9HELI|nr:dUTP diphosphatase [Helicobacter saguini]MWV62145.1 dUTP diphosphatase [Helicobacter saguini]MWV67183.1 dUTP diphosphatase [Helicobacter saguini]MWV69535.1 dUTP diphosphatase [Helicobacter saguini]MWV70914.1 dUTP diphosphatase [Helicobacter saguini]TLD92543.1 dUTP diphosphatase [Helicobacter saguini]
MQVEVKFLKLDKDAKIPFFASEEAAGFDFHSLESIEIKAGKSAFIRTGLSVELPQGYELQVRSRSGLALKNSIMVLNSPGTIDSDYRGEIKIILMNFGDADFSVKVGDRIAQGVVNKLPKVIIKEVDSISETKRGTKGFGSSGV